MWLHSLREAVRGAKEVAAEHARGSAGHLAQQSWKLCRSTAVGKALPPSKQIQEDVPRDAQKATRRPLQCLQKGMGLDTLFCCSSPVLTALTVLLYHRNAAPKVIPSGSWGLGNNKTPVWNFLLENQGKKHRDLFYSSFWSFPSTSYSPFLTQQLKRGQLTVGAFGWAFGFPSVCITTEMVEMLFCAIPSTLRQLTQ